MKTVLYCFMVIGIFFSYSVTGSAKENTIMDEVVKNAKAQSEAKKALIDSLAEYKENDIGLSQVGDFYFTDDNNIIIQLKKNPESKMKTLNIEKAIEKATLNKVNKFQISYVNYSNQELKTLISNFYKENDKIVFSPESKLNLDTINNQVKLTTNKLNQDSQKHLSEKYGEKLKIIIDPSYENNSIEASFKARKDDWNKLGAGIGVKYRDSLDKTKICSTAGVVKKDSRYFLLTAGHCVGAAKSLFYQWDKPIGSAHLDARASDWDFGLIRITQFGLSGGRYASNGLYKFGNSSGYDATLTGTESASLNQKVCKTGVTTGYTCGYVKDTFEREGLTGEITIQVKNDRSEYLVAGGDSGGALVNPYNNKLIGMTSKTSKDKKINNNWHGYTGYFTPYIEPANNYGVNLYTSNTPSLMN